MVGTVNPLVQSVSSETATIAASKDSASAPTAAMLIHEFELDGVRCFWAPGHGEMTAGLVFGVGEGDEQFHQRGLTSLIVDLALRRAGAGSGAQWSVDASHAVMQMSGPSVEVQPFLRTLVRSLSSLPTHDLASTSKDLVAKSLKCADPASQDALSILYGFEGPGASALPAIGLLAADQRAVDAWLRKFFVRENVAAFFYGPRPDGHSFANLASGQRPERLLAKPPSSRPPTMHRSVCGGPSLFSPIEPGRASAMVVDVARERLAQQLGQLVGSDCAVTATLTDLDAKTAWLAIRTHVDQEHHQRVFEVMRSELYRLAAEGPGSREIDQYVERMDSRQSSLGGNEALAEVRTQAQSLVRGAANEPYPDFRAALSTLTPTALGLPLLRSMPTAIWVVPKDSPANDPNMEQESAWGRQFPGRTDTDAFPDRVEYAQGHIGLRYVGQAEVVVLSCEDVVGVVGLPNGVLEFHTRTGLVLPVDPDAPGAGEPIVSFLAKLPAELLLRVERKLIFEVVEPETSAVPSVQHVEPVAARVAEPSAVAEPFEAVEPAAPQSSAVQVISEVGPTPVVAEPNVATYPLEPVKDDIEDSAPKRRFLAKKERKAEADESADEPAAVADPLVPSVPDDRVTYCYPSATQFAEAIVAGAWPMAERFFDEAADSPDNQAHLLHVASLTGGDPTRFDPWVEGASSAGLALMIRGASRHQRAWYDHLNGGDKTSSRERKRLLEEFQAAEKDLVLSTLEMEDSPVPWVPLLATTRVLSRPRAVAEQRYVAHVERGGLLAGHLEFQKFVSKRWAGSHQDMWEHVQFVCEGAEDGSATLAVAPMAFIEHWLDECASGTNAANGSWLLRQEGLAPLIDDAIDRSYGSQTFDLLSTAAAKALEIFFTYHWSVADFASAAALTPRMGRRFSGEPMGYFSQDPWEVVSNTAHNLAESAG